MLRRADEIPEEEASRYGGDRRGHVGAGHRQPRHNPRGRFRRSGLLPGKEVDRPHARGVDPFIAAPGTGCGRSRERGEAGSAHAPLMEMVEPAFGQIKQRWGSGSSCGRAGEGEREWSLICICHSLKMFFRSGSGPPGCSFHRFWRRLAFTAGICQAGTRPDMGDGHEQG